MGKTANRTAGLTAGEAIAAYRICYRDPADSAKAKLCASLVKPPQYVSLAAAIADEEFATFEELKDGDVIEVIFAAACADGRSVSVATGGKVTPVTAGYAGYIVGEAWGAVSVVDGRGFVKVSKRVSEAITNITAG